MSYYWVLGKRGLSIQKEIVGSRLNVKILGKLMLLIYSHVDMSTWFFVFYFVKPELSVLVLV